VIVYPWHEISSLSISTIQTMPMQISLPFS